MAMSLNDGTDQRRSSTVCSSSRKEERMKEEKREEENFIMQSVFTDSHEFTYYMSMERYKVRRGDVMCITTCSGKNKYVEHVRQKSGALHGA
jgi:hypothetical protein